MESAGIIVSNADLTLCYDERGAVFLLDSLPFCYLFIFVHFFLIGLF